MEQMHFLPIQHLLHPFTISTSQKEKIEVSTLKGKVTTIALAIITGVIASILAGVVAGITAGGAAFYALTAYHKIRFISDFRNYNNKPPAIIEKEPEQPIKGSPKDLQKEEVSKFAPLFPFFEAILKPTFDQIFAKAAEPNLCFIKNKTAPFPFWFQKEYQGADNIQTRNLHYLREKRPEIEKGLFIDIRGDGDCTIRSIGAGLLLQSTLEKPLPSYEELFKTFEQITNQLERDAAAIGEKIKEMRAEVEKLRREAAQSDTLLEQHPEQYRMANGSLNEEGANLKAGCDEKREMALIIERQAEALNLPQNQNTIQEQIKELKHAQNNLSHYSIQELKELTTPVEMQKKMVELMEREEFDQSLIIFLRKASSLNIALNATKMGNYMKHLENQEEVILGELSIFDLLMRRANARQPGQEFLQGSINDALSLSILFQQPITWYRSEVYFEPEEKIIHDFMPEYKNEKKKQLFILNRPGHSDLILV